MTTDRELLELAAKAAGMADYHWYEGSNSFTIGANWGMEGKRNSSSWNPLVNDGDALRLAVKLNLPVAAESCNGTTWVCRRDVQIYESHGDDPYAATRRAIVRAAAEIGAKK